MARRVPSSGAEALVRWRHPDLGLLLPLEFIPLAEENGLIIPLGEWVLRTACAQNHAWQAGGLQRIRVVANLSSRQLKRSLVDTVNRALETADLEARYLGLELTESMLVNHEREGTDTLHALRAMGLHLAVDDFGTGYSSLSYLKHFPLDTLKIDRTFVREIASDPDDAAITTAIIAMGHALGLRVVAEGSRDGSTTEPAAASRAVTRCRDISSAGRSRRPSSPSCSRPTASAREPARRSKIGSAART